MTRAVQLYFDEDGEARVRRVWAALEAAGLDMLAPYRDPAYRPHVSLAVFSAGQIQAYLPRLQQAAARLAGHELLLPAAGFFLDGPRPTGFLGVAMTSKLLDAHRRVAALLTAAGARTRPFYLAGSWTPHCTIPVETADVAAIVTVIRRSGLPIRARIAGARVIEVPSSEPPGPGTARRQSRESAATGGALQASSV